MALLTVRKDVVQVVASFLSCHRHRLELLQQRLEDASPEKQLARGYSITLKDGKIVKDVRQMKVGDKLVTHLYQGKLLSVVQKKMI